MKTLRSIKEQIANVSAGIGVRGFGDVSGTPKVGNEDENNPHIDRVIQGAEEYQQLVKQFINNNTDGIYTWEGGFDWWADKKGMLKYTKGRSSEPLGLKPLDSKTAKEFGIQEEIANVTGAAVPGTGDDPQAFPKSNAIKKHKMMTRAKPNEVGSSIMEVKRGKFAGEETFVVPSHVFERARFHKAKGKHWRTYISDETFHPAIREYAYKSKGPIIFEDEKTGYMCYARYGKKRK